MKSTDEKNIIDELPYLPNGDGIGAGSGDIGGGSGGSPINDG